MSARQFSVTWDYRCPFARNAHEHVLDALAAGAPWDVTFVPFSLDQVHVAEGEPAAWENPDKAAGLLALQAGVVVRDRYPDRFWAAHRALFAARHDQGRDLREVEVVRDALDAAGLPGDGVLRELDAGWPLAEVRTAYERCVADFDVFGVPTFVVDDEAAFVRLMTRPHGDGRSARQTIERVLDLVTGHPELNELKHTRISH